MVVLHRVSPQAVCRIAPSARAQIAAFPFITQPTALAARLPT
jgi:hypothetical protein